MSRQATSGDIVVCGAVVPVGLGTPGWRWSAFLTLDYRYGTTSDFHNLAALREEHSWMSQIGTAMSPASAEYDLNRAMDEICVLLKRWGDHGTLFFRSYESGPD